MKPIADVFSEVREFFIKHLKKDPPAYDKVKILALGEEKQDELYGFLVGFRDTYMRDYFQCLDSVPKSTWEYYALLEIKNTAEHKLLAQAKKDLLEAWAKRPEALKRGHRKDTGKARGSDNRKRESSRNNSSSSKSNL